MKGVCPKCGNKDLEEMTEEELAELESCVGDALMNIWENEKKEKEVE